VLVNGAEAPEGKGRFCFRGANCLVDDHDVRNRESKVWFALWGGAAHADGLHCRGRGAKRLLRNGAA
jgi:hypothetical protein